MTTIISGTRANLSETLLRKMGRYRHDVFLKHLGWRMPVEGDSELDQFDRPDTVYVGVLDDSDDLIGFARLLPTIRPYLLSEVFAELLDGSPPFCSPQVWELSRFTALDLKKGRPPASWHYSSPVAITLLEESIQVAAAQGAEELVTVSPIGVERLLRRAGFETERAGPPMLIGSEWLFACIVRVSGHSRNCGVFASASSPYRSRHHSMTTDSREENLKRTG